MRKPALLYLLCLCMLSNTVTPKSTNNRKLFKKIKCKLIPYSECLLSCLCEWALIDLHSFKSQLPVKKVFSIEAR